MADHHELQPPSWPSPADSNSNSNQSVPVGRFSSNNPYARHVTFAPASDNHVARNAEREHPSSNPTSAPPPGLPQTQSHPRNPPSQAESFPQQDPPPYSSSSDPPTNHDWQSIPDTSLLPPPPSISYNESPVANASDDSATAAKAWVAANPLWPPHSLDDFARRALSTQYSSVIAPRELRGSVRKDAKGRAGVWRVSSERRCDDACLLSSVPLYSALEMPGGKNLSYFEVKVLEMDRRKDAGVALGFVAPPYPSFRLPGWERASMGVHGDDGRRFVNNSYGGQDFTKPFKDGETLGVGVEFAAPYDNPQAPPPTYSEKERQIRPSPQTMAQGPRKFAEICVFFTRNGTRDGQWDMREEVDSSVDRPGGIIGLEGERDLHAAVGVYGAVEFEVIFGRHNWLYQPQR